jgi:hypothetical protein
VLYYANFAFAVTAAAIFLMVVPVMGFVVEMFLHGEAQEKVFEAAATVMNAVMMVIFGSLFISAVFLAADMVL